MEIGDAAGNDENENSSKSTHERSQSAGSVDLNNVNLQKRRCANDPDMMSELHRYRKLMLLTILPSIAPDSVENKTSDIPNPHAYLHSTPITPTPPIDDCLNKQFHNKHIKNRTLSSNNLHNEFNTHFFPAPVPVDTDSYFVEESTEPNMLNLQYLSSGGATSDQLSKSVGCVGSGSAATAAARKQIKSASSENRLPAPTKGGIPLVDQPSTSKGEYVRKGNSRRQSIALQGGEAVNGHQDSDTSELDLLTLAELYLETRHRVFGDEWHQRPAVQYRNTTSSVGKVGSTGINQRPHHLTPLAMDSPTLPQIKPKAMGVSNAGGLHLSVNYTNNLDAESSMLMKGRSRALKPRLRRLNSLDQLSTHDTDFIKEEDQDLHRPLSAPDMANRAADKLGLHDLNSRLEVTPARANTPTSAPRSSDTSRPPLIGASLATSLARISSSRPDTRDSRRAKSRSPDRKSPSRLSGLYPDESDIPHRSSFRRGTEVRHQSELEVLQELKPVVHGQITRTASHMNIKARTVQSQGSLPSTPPQILAKRLVAPIGTSSSQDTKTDIIRSTATAKAEQQILSDPPAHLSRRNSKILDAGPHHRPLHHSLPGRLSTPLAPPPTALAELGRKNSRVILTPLDPNRKISAP